MKLTNMTTGDSRTIDDAEDLHNIPATLAALTIDAGHPIGVHRDDVLAAAVVIATELPAVVRGTPNSIAFADAMNLLSLDLTN